MLIIIIAWLYVVVLMALTEHSVIAGVMTLLLYGVLPLATVVYLLNTPARRARRAREAMKAEGGAGSVAAGASKIRRDAEISVEAGVRESGEPLEHGTFADVASEAAGAASHDAGAPLSEETRQEEVAPGETRKACQAST